MTLVNNATFLVEERSEIKRRALSMKSTSIPLSHITATQLLEFL